MNDHPFKNAVMDVAKDAIGDAVDRYLARNLGGAPPKLEGLTIIIRFPVGYEVVSTEDRGTLRDVLTGSAARTDEAEQGRIVPGIRADGTRAERRRRH